MSIVPMSTDDYSYHHLAVRTGLEPVTPCVTGMYSNQTELTHQGIGQLDEFIICPLTGPIERQTRLELATPTLARSCSTN